MNTQVLREFSENIDTEGFDLQAGQTWIYPTNYPVRDYQFNIVSECLFRNTLVSLPTGLGKTFIAAVVMYNFYRWYPSGKIVFMAPTKPLVKQQIEACYNIMAIPKETTAELTGTKAQISRKDIWMCKRVFFITPQVLQNDINTVPELGKQIKCIVIDEAHKAKGNHAYCEVLRQITECNKHFRVLALSATPGSTITDVTEIINNLLISHLEIRTDDSPDVAPYVFERRLEKVVVPLGEKLQSVKADYLQILEKYTRILVTNRVIAGNFANLTKGRIFMISKEFQEKNKHTKMRNYGDIMRNLNLCITLYHGYELLIRHGLRGFLNYFKEHSEQALLRGNTHLQHIMMDVDEYLGPPPSIDMLPDGSTPQISPFTKFGHPKFYKLQEIILNHFCEYKNSSSRVIIFSEYIETVKEIYALLVQHTPAIKPKYFLGQSSITQKQQIHAVNSFRSGDCNTLISTCIGEEGLDIGEVDLIVCFDISNKSPIRLVQRMGRTGRKKEGKIIVLVTEGKEEEILKECLVNKHYLSKNILKSREIHSNLFQHNPRMIPDSLTPTCQKIHVSVPKLATKTKQKQGSLKSMLNNMAGSSKSPSVTQLFSDIEIIEIQDRIPKICTFWDRSTWMDLGDDGGKLSLPKRLESLRVPQPTNIIGHSKNCDMLTSLLQYGDSKRYNIPISQIRVPEVVLVANKKTTITEDLDNVANLVSKAATNDLINELHNEISSYISLSCLDNSSCKICDKLFTCYCTNKRDYENRLDAWIQPDLSILNDLNLNNILKFDKILNPIKYTLDDTDLACFSEIADQDWDEFDTSYKNVDDRTHNFKFEAPKTCEKIINDDRTSMSALDFFKLDKIEDMWNCNDVNRIDSTETSPILNSADPKGKIWIRKNLFDSPVNKPKLSNLNVVRKSDFFKSNNDQIETKEETAETQSRDHIKDLLSNIGDFCDLSVFGIATENESKIVDIKEYSNSGSEDLFGSSSNSPVRNDNTALDKTDFTNNVLTPETSKTVVDSPSLIENDFQENTSPILFKHLAEIKSQISQQKLIRETKIDDICDLSIFGIEPQQKERDIPPLSPTIGTNKRKFPSSSDDSFESPKNKRIKSQIIAQKQPPSAKNKPESIRKQNKPESAIRCDSDDDFEDTPFKKSNGWICVKKPAPPPPTAPKPVTPKIGNKQKRRASRPKQKVRPMKNRKTSYIDDEAILTSSDEAQFKDSNSEGGSSDDAFEMSFVNDATQDIANTTDMHVKYLQTTKSPQRSKGLFKIPKPPPLEPELVFSQDVDNTGNDTYLNDSFCVDDDVNLTQNDDLSELELAEIVLEKRCVKKKDFKTRKKPLVILLSSDSD
ncbi:fanconi anemia group m fancm family member [Holotrichia oblita]|uniref:Fanconi anemia group m fancm family member n=1 Tax=Holotrichia oblita TaxID=644536 RepID=A0ACB9TQP0_HOLOL|nr:fanconi anemia group m fancm family member [Holotrichia oblita]